MLSRLAEKQRALIEVRQADSRRNRAALIGCQAETQQEEAVPSEIVYSVVPPRRALTHGLHSTVDAAVQCERPWCQAGSSTLRGTLVDSAAPSDALLTWRCTGQSSVATAARDASAQCALPWINSKIVRLPVSRTVGSAESAFAVSAFADARYIEQIAGCELTAPVESRGMRWNLRDGTRPKDVR